MNITRWNLMGLVLLALSLNSGLAQAANNITSMTPNYVRPGQLVTLHGQFNVAKFRSRQYRIMVTKKIAPRPQGAINGAVDAFRVTPTSVMVRIPRTWRGKSVYSGNYVVGIKDMVNNRWVFFGESVLMVRSGARTAPEAAKRIILNQKKMVQQRRLGGNIGRAASPRTSFGRGNIGAGLSRGTTQMKLTLKDIRVNNHSALSSGVSIGDRVAAWFNIQNLGTAAERVRVGYMVGGRPKFISDGFVNVAPGQTLVNVISVRITPSDTHQLRGTEDVYWGPTFALLTTDNATYRDSYMADNVVQGGALKNILVKAHVNLAVERIDQVALHNTFIGVPDSEPEYATVHPTYFNASIHIKNKGIARSQPAHITVTLTSTRQGRSEAQNSRGAREVRRGGACRLRNGGCPINQNIAVASIPAGQSVSIPVRFNNIPFSMWLPIIHSRARMSSGPYLCDFSPIAIPSSVRIAVHVTQARGTFGENRLFRKDDTLVQTGTFGKTNHGVRYGYEQCGLTNIRTQKR